MDLGLFDFDLPRALIAQHPAVPRDAARLLRVKSGSAALEDRRMTDLPDLLSAGDLLIHNDTKVVPARLTGRRPNSQGGSARIEVTLHRDLGGDRWKAFARPARKLRPGDRIDFAADFAAEVVAREEGGEVTLAFDCGEGTAFLALLDRHGRMPLPPYILRGAPDAPDGDKAGAAGDDQRDREAYQTVFARQPGAVAAPTAGLHFTPDLLERLAAKGVRRESVTLHVGAGTFLPVKCDDVADHKMHKEWGRVDETVVTAVAETRQRGGQVIAIGTTSLRILEAAALAGGGELAPFSGETDIFILPGFDFRVVDRLLTNFHLPRSTLFMLVSAFAGLAPMHAAYEHAKLARYRFYSYGDACLLDRAAGASTP